MTRSCCPEDRADELQEVVEDLTAQVADLQEVVADAIAERDGLQILVDRLAVEHATNEILLRRLLALDNADCRWASLPSGRRLVRDVSEAMAPHD